MIKIFNGIFKNRFSMINNEFQMTHQNENNRIIHTFTIFMTWFSLIGLFHRHIRYINIQTEICMLFLKFNLVYFTIDDIEQLRISLYSCIFLGYSLSLFNIFDKRIMSTLKYLYVLGLSIAIQELSHIVYNEQALMYQYKGNFLENFLLHGWFLVPLVMKWYI
jgi:uncharacterized membrane protein YGL010W